MTGTRFDDARAAESLFRKTTGDGRQSVTAAVSWLKTRAGWKNVSPPAAAAGFVPLQRPCLRRL